MCGIAGLFYRDGRPVDPALLKKMTDTISHRGPDSEGHWISGAVGLGHRRLAIRDLSPSGAQPMASADGSVVVVFNGEIYNDRELKAELSRDFGYRFTSTSDTEVIPAGYKAWGTDLFRRLEGMFAIALWDSVNQKLVLARDAVGIKPLFYYADDRQVRFGSEIKALLADPSQSRSISTADFCHFLSFGYPGPESSLINGVRQLPPGSVMLLDKSTSKQYRYWQPSRTNQIKDFSEAVESFQELFQKVVSDQLVSDVPLVVLQSGGIDSSLVSLSLPQKTQTSLYNVRFRQKDFDESTEAGLVAAASGHKLFTIAAEAGSPQDILRAIAHHTDGQLGDSSAFPLYLVCEAITKKAKVVLSGDGGDEFFGGYSTYMATRLASMVSPLLPSSLWLLLSDSLRRVPNFGNSRVSFLEKLSRFSFGLSATAPHAEWRRYLYPEDAKKLLTKEQYFFFEQSALGYGSYMHSKQGSVTDRALLADQSYYLPADLLVKTDRISMAHSLEVRVPFLDKRIMDFAGSLDRRLLLSSTGETKRILRETLVRSGGPETIVKKAKRGFNFPVTALLATELNGLAKYFFEDHPDIYAPMLDPQELKKMWREQEAQQINRSYFLWSMLIFGIWKEKTGI